MSEVGRHAAGARAGGASRAARGSPAGAALLLAGAALGVTWAPGRAQERAGAPPTGALGALSRTQARAAAAAAPSLVRVVARDGRTVRSGVVVAPGLVLTCATAIDAVGVDDVTIEDLAGRSWPARWRGRDLRLRLAALAADGLDAPPLARAPAAARSEGTLALALGTSLASGGLPTVTTGIVSAVGRFDGRADQTDAPLDGSNLGGALVGLDGRLLGVTVHVDDRLGARSGVGFAVPWARIAPVLERLRNGDELEPGWLGVTIPREDDAMPGVLVRAVAPGSPAAAGGLRAGDRLLALDGRPTHGRVAFREALADVFAGRRLTLTVLHDGVGRSVTLTAGPRP